MLQVLRGILEVRLGQEVETLQVYSNLKTNQDMLQGLINGASTMLAKEIDSDNELKYVPTECNAHSSHPSV